MDAAVKITVLRRTLTEGLVGRYTARPWQHCERLADGQEFISTGANMPAGFCSWAWADIQVARGCAATRAAGVRAGPGAGRRLDRTQAGLLRDFLHRRLPPCDLRAGEDSGGWGLVGQVPNLPYCGSGTGAARSVPRLDSQGNST
jgi:uncharacterized repeat protein (TIGR04076 family)